MLAPCTRPASCSRRSWNAARHQAPVTKAAKHTRPDAPTQNRRSRKVRPTPGSFIPQPEPPPRFSARGSAILPHLNRSNLMNPLARISRSGRRLVGVAVLVFAVAGGSARKHRSSPTRKRRQRQADRHSARSRRCQRTHPLPVRSRQAGVSTLSPAGPRRVAAFTSAVTPQAKSGAAAGRHRHHRGPGGARQVTYNGQSALLLRRRPTGREHRRQG